MRSIFTPRPMLLGIRIVLVILIVAPLALPIAVGAAEQTVTITDSLSPREVTVAAGTTVTWLNRDDDRHRMRAESGPHDFDTGNLESGESYSYTFTRAGRHTYVDHRDEDDTRYHGVIVVEGAPPSTTTTTVPPGTSTTTTAPPPTTTPPTNPPTTPPPTQPPQGGADVRIVDRLYSPSTITVPVGTVVDWRNDDDREHTVTARDFSFDSGIFDTGGTYSRRFEQAGTFEYFCIIHPDMVGSVVVTGNNPPPVGTTTTTQPPTTTTTSPTPTTTTPPTPSPGSHDVAILDFSFGPQSITVESGSTVTWANTGQAPHTVTAVGGGFDSGFMFSGDRYSRTFTASGTYEYFCTLHPEMTGTVTVAEPNTSQPPLSPTTTTPTTSTVPPPTTTAAPLIPPRPPGGASVAIVDFDYNGRSVTVDPGAAVVWTNSGQAPHTVTAVGGGFDSGFLFTGETYQRTFSQPGTYEYFCTLHPQMTGMVIVAGTSPPSDTSTSPNSQTPDQPTPGPDGASSTRTSPPANGDVAIVDNGYSPRTLTVDQGARVTFANTGAIPHTVTSRDGTFDSGFLLAGDTYSRTFRTAGTFTYFCTIHPGMEGTVVVNPSSGNPAVASNGQGPADGQASETSSEFLSGLRGGLDVTAEGAAATPGRGEAEGRPEVRGVAVVDLAFTPDVIAVEAGTPVRWTNAGELPHTVTAKDGSFDSGIFEAGETYEATFDSVGVIEYFCTLHPDMVGTIRVIAPAVASADQVQSAGLAAPALHNETDPLAAWILGGSIIVVMAVFVIGMVRFGKNATEQF